MELENVSSFDYGDRTQTSGKEQNFFLQLHKK